MSNIHENLRVYRAQPKEFLGRETGHLSLISPGFVGKNPPGFVEEETKRIIGDPNIDVTQKIEVIYPLHAPRVYRYFLPRVRGQAHIAEDLTGEVFTRVSERLDTYEDRGYPFGAWLFRIAHNLLIDDRRRTGSLKGLTRGPKEIYTEEMTPKEELDKKSENPYENVETQELIAKGMAGLTDDQRTVVTLRFLQGLSLEETADATRKTVESVKKLQSRALSSMKRTLVDPSQDEDLA